VRRLKKESLLNVVMAVVWTVWKVNYHESNLLLVICLGRKKLKI
jgi:hypothetical protein